MLTLADVAPDPDKPLSNDTARKVVWQGHIVAGDVRITTQYYQPYLLKVHRARSLYETTWIATQDPLAAITVGGRTYKTKVCTLLLSRITVSSCSCAYISPRICSTALTAAPSLCGMRPLLLTRKWHDELCSTITRTVLTLSLIHI